MKDIQPSSEPQLLTWAKELQALAQAGLAYSDNAFERERYSRIREISAEIMAAHTDIPLERVKELFCNEHGYQTPKLDSRAAVFTEDAAQILLVKEAAGLWSLPGGWVDVDQTIRSNTIKEAQEEAGITVDPLRIIAILNRDNSRGRTWEHNITKVFVQCRSLGGEFIPNLETLERGWFAEDALPPIFESKQTTEQIKLCFQAARAAHWTPVFD